MPLFVAEPGDHGEVDIGAPRTFKRRFGGGGRSRLANADGAGVPEGGLIMGSFEHCADLFRHRAEAGFVDVDQ